MIYAEELEKMNESLRVYDVVQGVWEQEPNGPEANMRHVLTHLSKDLIGKDFTDKELVRTAIAPDSVAYGLRLGRWADLETSELVHMTAVEEDARNQAESGLPQLPNGFASFAGGMSILAQYLHELDHEKTRSDMQTRFATQTTMTSAARLLINSASIQSFQYGFTLVDAFEARLDSLRTRFKVPKPNNE